jgi:DNA-directed RNA polymerase subunit omega
MMNYTSPGTRLDMQKCADAIGNRFEMVVVAARRAREIQRGHATKMTTKSKPVVAALEEIQAGLVGKEYLLKY